MTERNRVMELLHGAGFGLVAAPLLSLLFFGSAFFIPAFGWPLSLFTPLPLVYYFFTLGRQAAHIALLAVSAVIAVLFGLKVGLIFILTHGLMAMVLAESVLRRDKMTKSVAAAAAIPMFLTVAYLWISLPVPATEVYGLLMEQVKAMIAATITSYEEAGVNQEQIAFLMQNTEQISKWLIMMMPGTMATGYLMMSLINYLGYKNLHRRWPFLPLAETKPVSEWSPPDKMVFVLIAALAMTLLPVPILTPVGANLLPIGLAVYTFTGICIIQNYFVQSQLPYFMRWAAYLLIVVQPFLLIMVACLGLFDLWFDFRKLKTSNGGADDDGIDP